MTVPPIETVAPTSVSAGGGALGALVGLSNFVYTIIKDHGHQCTFSTKDGGAGITTVPKDLPVRIESRYEHGGVWYTHTRAWASTIHSLYPHATTKEPKKLSSTYLCIIFPFKVTYAIAVPDVLALNAEIAGLELEIRKTRLEVKQKLLKDIAELDKDLPPLPEVPVKPRGYRTPDVRRKEARKSQRTATQQESDYEKLLVTYNQAKDKQDKHKVKVEYDELVRLMKELAAGQTELLQAKKELLDRKRDFRDQVRQHADVKYMTNVHLSGADGWEGLPSKAWQNVKVNANMTLRADDVSPGTSPTVSIDMAWGETAIGYGKSWTGTITLAPAVADVTGSGKFPTRFNQLAKIKKVA